MICPNCQKEVKEGAGYCPYCGSALNNNPPPNPQPQNVPEHPMMTGTQYYAPPINQSPYSPYPDPSYWNQQAQQPTQPGNPNAQSSITLNTWEQTQNGSPQSQPYPSYPYPYPSQPDNQTQAQPSQNQTQQAPGEGTSFQPYPNSYPYQNSPYSAAQPPYNAFQQQEQMPDAGTVAVQTKRKRIWRSALIAGGAVVIAGIVVALIFFVFLPGSNSGGVSTPTQVAEQFVSGLLDGDGEQILSVVPDKAINKMMEEQGYSSREEMAEEMSNTLQVFLFYIDMLDAQVGYTVGNPEPVDDYIMEDLQEAYGEIGLTVTDAKSVPISFTADGEETSDISSENILTVQINGRWYLDITQD